MWASFTSAIGPIVVGAVFQLLALAFGAAILGVLESVVFSYWPLGMVLCVVFAISSVTASSSDVAGFDGASVLSVDGSGLVFRRGAREFAIPRKRITDAVLLPAPTPGIEARLVGGDVVTLGFPDEERAHAVLERLGFAPNERRVAVRLGAPQRQLWAGCLVLPFAWIATVFLIVGAAMIHVPGSFISILWFLGFAVLPLLVIRARRPAEIVVGTDGVLVKRPFGERFHTYADIDEVEVENSSLLLRLRGQPKVRVAKGEHALLLAAERRIAEARAAGSGAMERSAMTKVFDLGGRSLAEWRRALAGLRASADYRSAALTPDTLWSIVENPSEERAHRVGAALLLRVSAPDAAPRLRIAADVCADDDLRAALERAAADELDDATLGRALRAKP